MIMLDIESPMAPIVAEAARSLDGFTSVAMFIMIAIPPIMIPRRTTTRPNDSDGILERIPIAADMAKTAPPMATNKTDMAAITAGILIIVFLSILLTILITA